MKHLRNRVFYKILIPTLFIYLLISSIGFIIYRSSYKNAMINNKKTEMVNVSRVLGDWIAGRISELLNISDYKYFQLENQKHTYLQKELTKKIHIFDSLWLIDENYSYWNTNNQTGQVFHKEKFSKLFSEELLFSYMVPEKYWSFSKDRILLFSVPITHDSRVIGILGGSIPLTELQRVINLYTYKVFDEYALIDVNDSILGQIGGSVIIHTNSQNNGLREVDVFNTTIASNTYNSDKNYFVADLINNWKFIGIIDSDNLYIQLKLFSQFFIMITILLIAVISILSNGVSQSISYPILQLRQMVNRMLQGDFNNEISLNTQDELQELADAFNLLNRRNLQLRTDDRFVFLGRISSRMAHEIRHPLHIIQIAMQTMNSENVKNNRSIITKEIKKAELFIREVLEIAKPNELSLQFYSMHKLIENILKSYNLINTEKNISIIYKNLTNSDSCYFDVLKMEQVITNILNNSFDATPINGIVNIKLKNDIDDNITLTICDTGIGFDKNIIHRVFDPYFTTKENGTGLGLSICYQIIAAHGAQIELKNSDLGGAETTIIFSSQSGNPA